MPSVKTRNRLLLRDDTVDGGVLYIAEIKAPIPVEEGKAGTCMQARRGRRAEQRDESRVEMNRPGQV